MIKGGPNGELSLTNSRINFGAKLQDLAKDLNNILNPDLVVPLLLQWAEERKDNKPSDRMYIPII